MKQKLQDYMQLFVARVLPAAPCVKKTYINNKNSLIYLSKEDGPLHVRRLSERRSKIQYYSSGNTYSRHNVSKYGCKYHYNTLH